MTVVNASEVDGLKVRIKEGEFREIKGEQLVAFNWARVNNKLVINSLILTELLKIIVTLVDGIYVDEMAGAYEITNCKTN